jgi:hypothetical protein
VHFNTIHISRPRGLLLSLESHKEYDGGYPIPRLERHRSRAPPAHI